MKKKYITRVTYLTHFTQKINSSQQTKEDEQTNLLQFVLRSRSGEWIISFTHM